MPISRVAGGGKLTGPPSHLDLVLPENGAVAQKRVSTVKSAEYMKQIWLDFVFKPRKPVSGDNVDRC